MTNKEVPIEITEDIRKTILKRLDKGVRSGAILDREMIDSLRHLLFPEIYPDPTVKRSKGRQPTTPTTPTKPTAPAPSTTAQRPKGIPLKPVVLKPKPQDTSPVYSVDNHWYASYHYNGQRFDLGVWGSEPDAQTARKNFERGLIAAGAKIEKPIGRISRKHTKTPNRPPLREFS